MSDDTAKIAWMGSLRPYVGGSFDTDKLSGLRIGMEGGYFLKIKEDKELEKTMDITGIDFLAFGETDPTKGYSWATGGRVRFKKNYGLFSLALGTGVSARNASADGTSVQVGVPGDAQLGVFFDVIIIGGGAVYYPDAVSQHTVGEFKLGTDVLKLFTILDETSD